MRRLLLSLFVLATLTSITPVHAADVVLENEHLRISLQESRGFGLGQIEDRAAGRTFLDGEALPLWEIRWHAADGTQLKATATDDCRRSARVDTQGETHQATVTWADLKVGQGKARIKVVGTLEKTSRLSQWRLAVEWTDKALDLWEVDFPRLGGIKRHSAQDMLTIPCYWGRYCMDPVGRLPRYALGYPVSGSMQFWSLSSGGTGLYLASYDSDCWLKRWQWTADARKARGQWQATHLAPVPTPTPLSYELPYTQILGTFAGDWQDAAAIYRQWALQQPWCREGKIADRQSIPAKFKQVALWLKYYNEPGKVLQEVWDHQQYLQVPMSVHYYRYPISNFDDNYPEMLPAKPGFQRAVADMQALGAAVMPYTQGTIWDMDTQCWRREGGEAAAAKQENGDVYRGVIGPNQYADMCPAAKTWQQKVFDFTSKLVWDYGVDGVYLDVLSAGQARPCHDPSHGHTIHGGNSWGQGNRQLMEDLRRRIRAKKPEAFFTTEEICEVYLDKFDGFLTLDVTRGGYHPPVMLLPLFTAVYHDYAIQYGSDCALSTEPDYFAALMAEHLVWGAKPTLSEMTPPRIEQKPESAAYLREVTRCYDKAGRKFLLEGQWLRAPKLDVPSQNLTLIRKGAAAVSMPVVRHSLWRAEDGSLGLIVTNWTRQPQKVDLALDPADYGLNGSYVWQQLWPATSEKPKSGGETLRLALTLPPRSVRLFEVSTASRQPLPAAPEEKPVPSIVLRRDAKSNEFPTTSVEPGTLWYGRDAKLAIAADGTLAIRELRTQDDFVLLRRYPVRLGAAQAVEADWFGEDGLALTVTGGKLVLENPAGCQVVARHAAGRVAVVRRGDQAEIDFAGSPGTVWLTGPIARLPLGADSFQASLEQLAARSQAAARQWDDLHQSGADLSRLMAAAAEQRAVSAAAGAAVGTSLRIVVPPHVRAVPHEPLTFPVMMTSNTSEPDVREKLRVELVANRRQEMAELTVTEALLRGRLGKPGRTATVGHCRLIVNHRDLAEHAVTIRATVDVLAQGQRFVLVDETHVPVDMPLLVELAKRKQTLVAGRTADVAIEIRNVAPQPLTVAVKGKLPSGWQTTPAAGLEAQLPAANGLPVKQTLHLGLTSPLSARQGTLMLPLVTTYNGHQADDVITLLQCDVLPSLRPLVAEDRPFQAAAKPSRIRREGRAMLYLKEGEKALVAVHNLRVTTYSDGLSYRVLDPDLKEVAKGSVKVDESRDVAFTAGKTGVHFIEVHPGSGSCTITTPLRPFVLEASKAQPLIVFTQNPPLYFFVPSDARRLALVIVSGGETETSVVKLLDPQGKTLLSENGAWLGRRFEVDVPADARGKVWQLLVAPREDVSFHLEGDVVPYVADDPARLLIPE
jgi:hypothetical protein